MTGFSTSLSAKRTTVSHNGITPGKPPGTENRDPIIYGGTMSEVITARGYHGSISFDGSSVTITRPWFANSQGRSGKTIPVSKIQAMQYTPAKRWKGVFGLRGYISFTLAGGLEKQARWGKQIAQANRDENAVIIKPTHRQIAEFDALATAIRAALQREDSR